MIRNLAVRHHGAKIAELERLPIKLGVRTSAEASTYLNRIFCQSDDAKRKVVGKNVEYHVEEENEMFPKTSNPSQTKSSTIWDESWRRQKTASSFQRKVKAPSTASNLMSRPLMPRGDKSKYTDKQKLQAEHIEEGYPRARHA